MAKKLPESQVRVQRVFFKVTGYEFALDLAVKSAPNRREHWAVKYRRGKNEKTVAKVETLKALGGPGPNYTKPPKLEPPYDVTLTAQTPWKLDPDNLANSLKSVQDGIAEALGVDDGDAAKVSWKYGWRKGRYLVTVAIRRREA